MACKTTLLAYNHNHLSKYLGAHNYLEQLVTIPESVGAAHGSLGEDGPDVMMGPDLLTILHIHCKCSDQWEASINSIDQWEASINSIDQWEASITCALEADAETPSPGNFLHVTNLEEKIMNLLF